MPIIPASACFAELRGLFEGCVQGQGKLIDITDDTEILLVKAYEAERDCFLNLDAHAIFSSDL